MITGILGFIVWVVGCGLTTLFRLLDFLAGNKK